MLESLHGTNFEYQKLTPEEQQQRGILGRLIGICADFINPTRNGRKYSEELWEKVFSNPIMKERIENGVCYGELGHPEDRTETDMEKIAVCLSEVPKKGSDGKLRAVFDILSTPNGKILKALCDYGSILGVSSRGSGDVETDYNGNESVDPDSYDCEGFDIVLIPAVKSARLTYVTESLDTKNKKSLNESLSCLLEDSTEEEKKVMQDTIDNLNLTDNADTDMNNTWIVGIGDFNQDSEPVAYIKTLSPFEITEDKNDAYVFTKNSEGISSSLSQVVNDESFIRKMNRLFKYESVDNAFDFQDKYIKIIFNDETQDELNEATYNKYLCRFEVINNDRDPIQIADSNGDRIPFIRAEAVVYTRDEGIKYMNDHTDKDLSLVYRRYINGRLKDETLLEKLKSANKVDSHSDKLNEDQNDGQVIVNIKEDGFISKLHELRENGYTVSWTGNNQICMKKTDIKDESININKSKNTAVDNNQAIVEELKKMVCENNKLETKVRELQEKLSVCYAKEAKNEEVTTQYNTTRVKLTENLNKVSTLTEQLTKTKKVNENLQNKLGSLMKNIEITNDEKQKLYEQLKKKESDCIALQEKYNSTINEIKSLNENLEVAKKDLQIKNTELTKKLNESKKLTEQYKHITNDAVSKYLDIQATRLGVSVDEIKKKLPKQYSLNDVDTICESLSAYKLNLSKLPFQTQSLNESIISAKCKSSKNETLAKTFENPDDELDDMFLELAGMM